MLNRRLFVKALALFGIVPAASSASPYQNEAYMRWQDQNFKMVASVNKLLPGNPDHLPVAKFENGKMVNADELLEAIPLEGNAELDVITASLGRKYYKRKTKTWIEKDDSIGKHVSWSPLDKPFWGEAVLFQSVCIYHDGVVANHYNLAPTEKYNILKEQNVACWYNQCQK